MVIALFAVFALVVGVLNSFQMLRQQGGWRSCRAIQKLAIFSSAQLLAILLGVVLDRLGFKTIAVSYGEIILAISFAGYCNLWMQFRKERTVSRSA